MATITVVEPNTLLRLGILKLLQTMDCRIATAGLDYTQLFQGAATRQPTIDLMLLSVPDTYDRVIELVGAARQGYAPRRILLLSDTQSLPYSLLNLPEELAGYLCKYSSPEVLKTSVMLVLAGGKCFPHPDQAQAGPSAHDTTANGANPKRRWYDRSDVFHVPDTGDTSAANLLPSARKTHQTSSAAPEPAGPHIEPLNFQLPTSERITQEAGILQLTPRQYEVLAMLAQGYPLKKVSRELNISVATVKTHTEAVYQRLGVNNRNAAVYAAISRGATFGWQEAVTTVPDRLTGTSAPSPAQPD